VSTLNYFCLSFLIISNTSIHETLAFLFIFQKITNRISICLPMNVNWFELLINYIYLINHYNIKLYILLNYNEIMSVQENEVLVKITSAGTISIPKQFRKFMDVQKGEYVKMILGKDRLIVRKVTIT